MTDSEIYIEVEPILLFPSPPVGGRGEGEGGRESMDD